MLCCLNPDCLSPLNPEGSQHCHNCNAPLTKNLRSHYRVTKVLSQEGGFGRTYLAEDIDKYNELCVVKQLAPKSRDIATLNKATELFQQEAKRLQELGQHPQIPTLLAYFEDKGYLYLVQQFIDGKNLLRDLEQRGNYSESQIWDVLRDLLPVLKFIHNQGVIHRDIKPQNIMRYRITPNSPINGIDTIGGKGDLVLIDFGASKQLTSTVGMKPGTTIGTKGYSPLEQIQGGEAYPASDLFSLGTTCFHLLTGIHPFRLWTENGYGWVSNWQQYLSSQISNELEIILDKLLKKDIIDRYQSADEVIGDLISQPTTSDPPPLPVTTPDIQWPPTESSTSSNIKKSSLPVTTPDIELPPTEPSTSGDVQKPQPVLRKKILALAGAAILLLGLGGKKIWDLYHPHIENPGEDVSSNQFLLKTLNGHGNGNTVTSIATSRDGKTLASGSYDGTVKLWNWADGKEIQTFEGNAGTILAVAIAPDGNTLISGHGNNNIKFWNITTQQEIMPTVKGHSTSVESLALSRDGKILASGSFDGNIKLWEVANRKDIRTINGHSSLVKALAISPDGNILVSGSDDSTIKVWKIANGEEMYPLKRHSDAVLSVAISPDGKTFATSSRDKTIKLWNLANGELIRTFEGHSESVNSVAFSLDGKTLASGSSDKTIKLWNVSNGQVIHTLKDSVSGQVTSVAFGVDGTTLASGSTDGSIKIWRVSQ